jgi:hypothetical protein
VVNVASATDRPRAGFSLSFLRACGATLHPTAEGAAQNRIGVIASERP